jgi:hypothetical protein
MVKNHLKIIESVVTKKIRMSVCLQKIVRCEGGPATELLCYLICVFRMVRFCSHGLSGSD